MWSQGLARADGKAVGMVLGEALAHGRGVTAPQNVCLAKPPAKGKKKNQNPTIPPFSKGSSSL